MIVIHLAVTPTFVTETNPDHVHELFGTHSLRKTLQFGSSDCEVYVYRSKAKNAVEMPYDAVRHAALIAVQAAGGHAGNLRDYSLHKGSRWVKKPSEQLPLFEAIDDNEDQS